MQTQNRPAFTMVEAIIGIAVTATLAAVLFPALGDARAEAHAIAAASIQRQAALGTTSYADRAKDWLPGVNTTGMRLTRTLRGNAEYIDADADIATQDVDWMTESFRGEDLPAPRADRMYALFERYADPALRRTADVFESAENDSASGVQGYQNMQNYLEDHGKRLHAVSYLMPIAFQLFGGRGEERSNGPAQRYWSRYGQYSPRFVPQTNDAVLSSAYTPRLTSLGAPSRKIANATGLRYFGDDGRITTNCAYQPTRVGAFATWGAMYSGSESYGQPESDATATQDRNETNGEQAPIVYRHKGNIIAAYFDGHAERLSVEESQNPALWYPSGSVMGNEGLSIVPKAFEFVAAGRCIP